MQPYSEPREEAYTTWRNPLDREQYVDLHDGDSPTPTRYRFAPGEEKKLPSRFDNAIHRTHNGVIVGGLAPQLVKVGSKDRLDTALASEARKPAADASRRRGGS